MKKSFAELYDEMMTYVDYDAWANLINDNIKDLIKEKKLLEIGCGTGEIAYRLQKMDYEVTAIDNSEDMLNVAARKYKNIDFLKLDMRDLKDEDSYGVVIAVFDTLNYLNDLEDLKKSFCNIKKSLKSKGVFLFDVLTKKMIEYMFPEGIFTDDRENLTIVWKHSKKNDLEEVKASFFAREKDNFYQRYDQVFMKKIFLHKEILEIAQESGFDLIKKEVNTEIAGPRVIYLFKRVD